MKLKSLFVSMIFGLNISYAVAQDNLTYQTPPDAIKALIETTPTPRISLDSKGKMMLLMQSSSYPSIAELAEPELRIAGLRLNPRNNGQSRTGYIKGISLREVQTGKEISIKGLPSDALMSNFSWSPDETKIAFCLFEIDKILLYVIDVKTAEAKKLTDLPLNATLVGSPFGWVSDNKHIFFLSVPANRGIAPVAPLAPTGPIIQENLGRKAPSRTYQDLLKNQYDEKLFEYYATSQLNKINIETNEMQKISNEGLIQSFSTSPDGNYILFQKRHKPYSYLLPVNFFPSKIEILDAKTGSIVKEVVDLPLIDNVPTGFDAIRQGQRNHTWRADSPATLFWVEAQDEGNPKKDVPIRDKTYLLNAPFTNTPQEFFGTKLRFSGIMWGDANNAIYSESWWGTRKEISTHINPSNNKQNVLFDRSSEDAYTDPGSPEMIRNQYGRFVMDIKNNKVLMTGAGASAEGNRPFLDEFDFTTKKSVRLWRSEAPYYENIVQILDRNKQIVITRRESVNENANYYIKNIKTKKSNPLTTFPHPYPQMKEVKKELLKYKRADGVELTAILYLPPNYKKENGALPTLMEAYPAEFKSKAAAGQVKGSPYEFTYISWGSPVFWALQGYAVMENASIPIVGEGTKEPNDTYIEQLIAGAKANIDEGVKLGVVDPNRVAVMGHSYGAFMTANLLTHSTLFKAGIARSGAYNRTLTPFGFQAEERTYWQAPETYNKMAPFSYADKIKTPILLIHGEADNNQGTFPIQSERYYNAIKGHGGIARYVVLPYESHGYRAKESILHMLWEMDKWLDKYVKNGSK
ncbi:MAG: S9 family peptidase [Bacteroidetes bacterium]|nr:MAG: S9 family peptidase [Bacteroidota bacterium]